MLQQQEKLFATDRGHSYHTCQLIGSSYKSRKLQGVTSSHRAIAFFDCLTVSSRILSSPQVYSQANYRITLRLRFSL